MFENGNRIKCSKIETILKIHRLVIFIRVDGCEYRRRCDTLRFIQFSNTTIDEILITRYDHQRPETPTQVETKSNGQTRWPSRTGPKGYLDECSNSGLSRTKALEETSFHIFRWIFHRESASIRLYRGNLKRGYPISRDFSLRLYSR